MPERGIFPADFGVEFQINESETILQHLKYCDWGEEAMYCRAHIVAFTGKPACLALEIAVPSRTRETDNSPRQILCSFSQLEQQGFGDLVKSSSSVVLIVTTSVFFGVEVGQLALKVLENYVLRGSVAPSSLFCAVCTKRREDHHNY
jgi:hypothetical protein